MTMRSALSMTTVFPRLQSAGIESGAFGGSKFNEVAERGIRDTERTLGDITADLTYRDFLQQRDLGQRDLQQRRELQQQGNALELSGGAQGAQLFSSGLGQGLQEADIFSNIADRERGFEQQTINDAINFYNEQRLAPFAGLGEYSGLVQGTAIPGTGTSTSNTIGYQPSGAGFLQGLGLANSLFPNALSGIGGALAGGLGGGPLNLGAMLFSGLPWSDRRLKENIVRAGS